MNRSIFYVFAVALLATTALPGCDTLAPSATSQDAVLAIFDLEGRQQRLAFSLLTPEERASVWRTRLDRIMAFEDGRAGKNDDAARAALLDEFDAIVTDPANFTEDRSTSHQAWLDSLTTDWERRAREVFTASELYDLVFRIAPDSTLSTTLPMELAAGKDRNCADCCCSVGSSFTCPQIEFSADDFGLSYGECYYMGCSDPSSMGCGFAGMNRCTGSQCVW